MIDFMNIVPLCAIGVGLIITVTAILASTISKYKLEAEKIRADAMVRAEEVRSRNQLELERLMRQEQKDAAEQQVHKNTSTEQAQDQKSSSDADQVRDYKNTFRAEQTLDHENTFSAEQTQDFEDVSRRQNRVRE